MPWGPLQGASEAPCPWLSSSSLITASSAAYSASAFGRGGPGICVELGVMLRSWSASSCEVSASVSAGRWVARGNRYRASSGSSGGFRLGCTLGCTAGRYAAGSADPDGLASTAVRCVAVAGMAAGLFAGVRLSDGTQTLSSCADGRVKRIEAALPLTTAMEQRWSSHSVSRRSPETADTWAPISRRSFAVEGPQEPLVWLKAEASSEVCIFASLLCLCVTCGCPGFNCRRGQAGISVGVNTSRVPDEASPHREWEERHPVWALTIASIDAVRLEQSGYAGGLQGSFDDVVQHGMSGVPSGAETARQ